MKIIIGILLLSHGAAFGWQKVFFANAAVDNIPAAFSTAAGSRVVTDLVGPVELCFFNETSDRMELNNQTYDSSTPSTVTHRIPASSFACITSRMASRLFVRSANGAGTVVGFIHGWVD